MNPTRPLFFTLLTLAISISVRATDVPQNDIFPRPTIVPMPATVAGMPQPVIVLNGTWKTTNDAPAEFWSKGTDLSNWSDLTIGGGGRGGFGGRGGGGGGGSNMSVFKKQFTLPAEFAGKRVVLRFDGVSNEAKVWVNGQYVRDHWGSFMAWTCDVTDFLSPADDNWLTVSVDNSPTGLAQFVRGGNLQREVKLLAEPPNYLTRFQVSTDLDKQYRDATMKVWLRMDFHQGDTGTVKISLKDAQGNPVKLPNDTVTLTRANPELIADIPVPNPAKWDAEHPNLYTLEATVLNGNATTETLSRQMGFIQLEMDGRKLLVNGKEVKFRGVWGMNNPATLVTLNINHTRQKWVTEAFLDECDRAGVYVIDESPVDFAKQGVPDDPQFRNQYLSFMADLIERDRSHPCIVTWGLVNESDYGANELPAFKYASIEDPSRLFMVSWPSQVPNSDPLPYSLFSYHYPNFDADLTKYGNSPFNAASKILNRQPQPNIPSIADEYAHLPIYDAEELARDPNVHNFWGESLKRYWERIEATPGFLGGDIFGLNDGQIPQQVPEAWLIKKAYSPIRADNQVLNNPGEGQPLSVPVKNWFDHTNLDEIKVAWKVGADSGAVAGPNIAPHADGVLQIPGRHWQNGETLNLQFFRQDGLMIDEDNLPISPAPHVLPAASGPAPQVDESADAITVNGVNFKLVFSKQTGLITDGSYQGTPIIQSGPLLQVTASAHPEDANAKAVTDDGQMTGENLAPWTLKSLNATQTDKEAVIKIEGAYGPVQVGFEVRVDGQGLITTNYTLHSFPITPPPAHAHPWNGSDYGGFREIGVAFQLAGDIDYLAWDRQSLWTAYPDGDAGRPSGVALRTPMPGGKWPTQGFGGGGRGGRGGAGLTDQALPSGAGTNDFRGMKEYIYDAAAMASDSRKGVQALSNGTDAVRLEISAAQPNSVRMIINNAWNYPMLGNGNYMKPPLLIPDGYSNTVRVRLVAAAVSN